MEVGNGDLLTFSWTSAFWIHNWVSNMVYSRYSDKIEEVRKVQAKLEDQFEASGPEVEEKPRHSMNNPAPKPFII